MKSLINALAAAVILLSLSPAVSAEEAKLATATDAALSRGEVKRIDQETGSPTIRHGELKNLGMPAMTMVFAVSDKAVLARLKTGDKITFIANNANGQLTATNVSPVE